MSYCFLACLFTCGVVIHNLEEAVWLPAWSARTGRGHKAVSAASFRFAVTILSLAVLVGTGLAVIGGKHSFGAYFLAGYALAMVFNVFVPHVIVSVALRTYAPGTATALLLNLPLGSWFIYQSLAGGYIKSSVYLISGPFTVLALGVSIPLLFYLGNWFTKQSCGDTLASNSITPQPLNKDNQMETRK